MPSSTNAKRRFKIHYPGSLSVKILLSILPSYSSMLRS
jgi:hypothetical protein